MRVESMHDKNDGFRLLGYRLVAESHDESRILNLCEWSIQREHFCQETAIQVILKESSTTQKSAKNRGAANAEPFTGIVRCCERDDDGDGNCPIHSAPGVFRRSLFDAS